MAESQWTPQSLNQAIAKRAFEPLYFFFGDESYLIEESLRALVESGLGEGLRDFNLNTFYGQDCDASLVRDAIETLPMMAQARVVVLREAQELTDKEWEILLPLIDSPVESTIFICVANKIDKRKKHIKRFFEKGVVVEFKRPYDNQIPEWILRIAKKHGLDLSNEAGELVFQLVGTNLSDINGEMLKLSQYLGTRKTVSADDVLKVVSRVRIDSVFELTDAIGANDRARALVGLANLLDNGQNEVGVLALISRHIRILKAVQDGSREGLTGAKLASRAGVSPYFLKSYADQAKRWNEDKFELTFRALLDTDRALKSSPVSSHIWLENLIVQTCTK